MAVTKQVSKYMSEIGKKGGTSGRGESKNRGSPESYRNLVRIRERNKARRAAKNEKI